MTYDLYSIFLVFKADEPFIQTMKESKHTAKADVPDEECGCLSFTPR